MTSTLKLAERFEFQPTQNLHQLHRKILLGRRQASPLEPHTDDEQVNRLSVLCWLVPRYSVPHERLGVFP